MSPQLESDTGGGSVHGSMGPKQEQSKVRTESRKTNLEMLSGKSSPWSTLILPAVSGTRKTMMLKQSVLAIFSVDQLLPSWGGNQDCADGKANQLLHPIHSLRSRATTIFFLDPPAA